MDNQQHLFSFDRDLAAFSRKLEIDLTTTVKKVAFDLLGRIVAKTPVDTGRARASWVLAVKNPSREVPGEGAHESYQTGDAPNPEAGRQAVTDQQAALAELRPYDPVWISNNLPYIEPLENGHSQQAPSGMVALSITETELELDTALEAAR